MSISTEIIIFLALIILGLMGALYWEHRHRVEQRDHFFWMSETAGLYVFDYDPVKDRMHLSETCASVLHLPEIIPDFRAAAERVRDPFEKVGIHFLMKAMQENDNDQKLCLTYANERTCFYRVNSHRFYDRKQKKEQRIMGFFSDVTSDIVKEQKLELKAATDHLTGVYNRGAIHELISETLRAEIPGAFIMLDIDYFKSINDSAGHQAGDAVLRGIVHILRDHIRHTDIIGRMGGDEFCVYLSNVPSAEFAQKLCERICSAVPSEISYGESRHPVTMSIGCTLSQPGDNFTSLYSRADNALYQSKRQGRNKVTVDALKK